MKTAISLPDPLFDAAEQISRRLGMSRSAFYAKAIEAYIQTQSKRSVKARLDEVYSVESSRVDPVLDRMQRRSILKEDW
jgi:metal-responsive CopG/Arc/MetJ family transcriptional regulator